MGTNNTATISLYIYYSWELVCPCFTTDDEINIDINAISMNDTNIPLGLILIILMDQCWWYQQISLPFVFTVRDVLLTATWWVSPYYRSLWGSQDATSSATQNLCRGGSWRTEGKSEHTESWGQVEPSFLVEKRSHPMTEAHLFLHLTGWYQMKPFCLFVHLDCLRYSTFSGLG